MGKGGRVLIVVTGPIAAGKSTFAARLADEVRSAGRSVAVVDPDFLRRTHDAFWAARATLVAPEPTHDTEHVSAGDLARTVAAGLPLSTGSGWEPD